MRAPRRRPALSACLVAFALSTGPVFGHGTAAAGAHSGDVADAGHADHSLHADPPAQADHTAHAGHARHTTVDAGGATARPSQKAVVRFADVPLLDQHSRERRLESDVVGDRIVVMDFVYTSCTTVCPVASAIMSEVQARLGERLGRDVALVSVSVDPVRDTPARLNDYARRYAARPGWSWLTGSMPAVSETLKGLGTWTPAFEDHPVVTIVGDGRTGKWTRFYGFADPTALVAQVESLIAARGATAGVKP